MASAPKIDEDVQSRQLAVYGREAMLRLARAKVLISGLDGLGAEVAKNVILANVNAVTLHDPEVVTMADLGSNFYTTEADVRAGLSRADACVGKLRELNPGVTTSVLAGRLTTDVLAEFSVVVAIDTPLDECVRINEFCRAQRPPIAFIASGVYGLAGWAFSDFGARFPCYDWSGEAIKSSVISHITQAEKAEIQCVYDANDPRSMHNLEVGDVVELTEVKGMSELNGRQVRVADVINPWKFSIDVDTRAMGAYFDGGIITEKRQPRVFDFQSLFTCLHRPGEMIQADFGKFGRPALQHIAFRALDKFRKDHKRKPAPGSGADADAVLAIMRELNAENNERVTLEEAELGARQAALEAALAAIKAAPASAAQAGGFSKAAEQIDTLLKAARTRAGQLWQERVDEIDVDVARKLTMGSSAVLNPLAAMFGGLVAQEVMKACSSKYTPLFQFFHFDALEALPASGWPLAESEYAPTGSRYDSQIAVFGRAFVDKLRAQSYFLVGSGALGCEYLKNFALMGVGTGPGAHVYVTDDDTIERSNLSRQFLFRNEHVKMFKSEVAAAAARAMNPELNITALQERAAPSTEGVFNDAFWAKLSGVCNALDNVKARLYVDARCVFYGKSLLESGTLGAKCNSQIVVPFQSEHYGSQQDPPEFEAPQCTLHNFPSNIDHCLVWAKSELTGNITTGPEEAAKVVAAGSVDAYVETLRASGASMNEILDKLRGDKDWGGGALEVLANAARSWRECVVWARNKWYDYVRNRVVQLVALYPEDALTDKGTRFWTAPKRFPGTIEFDLADPMTFQFVNAAARLRAKIFRLDAPAAFSPADAAAALADSPVPAFTPNLNASIETPEAKAAAAAAAAAGGAAASSAAAAPSDDDVATIMAKFPVAASLKSLVAPTVDQFEKDDDSNYHIAFVQALGNLRARTYHIPEVDFLKAKLAAGRIIPAIATATAMITGVTCLELYKFVHGHDITLFRNTFANLGAMVFAISDPQPATRVASKVVKTQPDPDNNPEYFEEKSLRAFPEPHNAWDAVVIAIGDATIGEVADWYTARGFSLTALACMGAGLYMSFGKTAADVRKMKVTDRVRAMVPTADLSRGYLLLEPLIETDAGDEGLQPNVIFKFGPCPLDGLRDAPTSLGKPVAV